MGRFDEPVYVAGSGRTLAVVERYGLVRDLGAGGCWWTCGGACSCGNPRATVDQRGLLSMAFAPDSRRRFYVMYVNRRERLRVDAVRRGRVRRILDLGPAASAAPRRAAPVRARRPALREHRHRRRPGGRRQDPALRPAPAEPRSTRPACATRGGSRSTAGHADRRRRRDHEFEEIDIATLPGADFGWPAYEGPEDDARYTPPVLGAPPPPWCAIVGGYVRRGRYLYGDCAAAGSGARGSTATGWASAAHPPARAVPRLVRPRRPRPHLRGVVLRQRLPARAVTQPVDDDLRALGARSRAGSC